MRTSLAIAAFVAVGGGAVSAAAATLPDFLGSDTLFQVTTQSIAACAGAAPLVGHYLGTGSGNGETAMKSGTQAIAPMSRFLGSGICAIAGGQTTLQATEGLVIGLDGVSVVGSKANAGLCNGDPTLSAACTPQPSAGLAFTGSITTVPIAGSTHASYTYTFQNWKDVLKIIYGGQSNSSQNTATGDSGCNSDIRNTLANSWGSLFQTGATCAAGSACTSAVPTSGLAGLQHAFRRDDASGTSDVFQQLLGLSPAPTSSSNRNFGTSPFCNVNEVGVASATATNPITITTTIPHGLTTGQTVTIVGVGKNIDNTQIAGPPAGNIAADGNNLVVTVLTGNSFTIAKDGTGATNGTAVGSYAMVLLPPPPGLVREPIPTDYREYDPIRRPCAQTTPTIPKEDVCNRDGKLGLVLPVVPTDFLGSNAAQYPLAGPTQSNFEPAAIVKDPNTGLNFTLGCPNGDIFFNGNACSKPLDGTGSGAVLAVQGTHPFRLDGLADIDGRVFNSHLLGAGTAPSVAYQVDTLGRPIVGAWYRIHSGHTISAVNATLGTGVKCTQVDATLQIGCLVQASPCSVGYAGRTASTWDVADTTADILQNEIAPATGCVQSFAYPLSRKLYLNTGIGWSNVSASSSVGPNELALAQCENNVGSSTTMNTILNGLNFVQFASGGALSEDFNEPSICPTQAPVTTPNVVAFTAGGNNAGVSMPTTGTVCGNGIKEVYEDCDDGTTGATLANGWAASYLPVNGGSGGTVCTNTCRWANATLTCDAAGTNDTTSTTCVSGTDDGALCHTTAVPSLAGKCQAGCCLP
jgi:hypothetical protein